MTAYAPTDSAEATRSITRQVGERTSSHPDLRREPEGDSCSSTTGFLLNQLTLNQDGVIAAPARSSKLASMPVR